MPRETVELRTLVISALGLALPIWDIAFKFGAYNELFYDRLHTLWIASTVLLLINFLIGKQQRFLGRWGILALLMPTVWAIINASTPAMSQITFYDEFVWTVALIAYIVCLPHALYIILSLIETDVLAMSRSHIVRLIGLLLFVALLGYLVGRFNGYFVSCQQFEIAGDHRPTNCETWDEFN